MSLKNKIVLPFASFLFVSVHVHGQNNPIQDRCDVMKKTVDIVDSSFKFLLEKGDKSGYQNIIDNTVLPELIEDNLDHDIRNSFNDIITFFNSEISKIITYLKKKPTTPDVAYIKKFGKEIDIVTLMHMLINKLANFRQLLIQKQQKDFTPHIEIFMINLVKIKKYWEEKVKTQSNSMFQNLLKSML